MPVPSVRAHSSNANTSSNTTLSLTVPSSTQVDDVLVAVVSGGAEPITTPSGWTLVGSNVYGGSSQLQLAVYKRKAVSGDASSTVNFVASAANKKAGVIAALQDSNDVGVSAFAGYTSDGQIVRAVPISASGTDDSREIFVSADRGAGSATATPPNDGIASSSVSYPSGSSIAHTRTGSAARSGDVSVGLGLGDEADNTAEVGNGNVSFQYANNRAATAVLTITPSTTPPPAGTIDYSWVGAPTSSSFIVKSRVSGGSSLRLAASLSESMTSPVYSASVIPAGGRATASASGLSADTEYFYQWLDTPTGGSETPVGSVGRIRTLGTPGSPVASRTIIFGGCIETYPDSSDDTALVAAVAEEADYGIFNGDFHYRGAGTLGTSTDPDDHIELWETQIVGYPTLDEFISVGLASFYCTSDHESGGNNDDSNNARTTANIQGYDTIVPHYPLGETDVSRDQQWDDGRFSFFMLDIRNTDRSPGLDTDDSSKTMLGADQKARLFNWLENNEQPWKTIISDVPWTGPTSDQANKKDGWLSYDTERQEIAAKIEEAQLAGAHVELWHGDYHSVGYVAAEDNDYGTFDILMAAGYFTDVGIRNSGEYTAFWNPGTGDTKAYGRITLTDVDGSIVRTFEGYDADGAVVRVTQELDPFTPDTADVHKILYQLNDEEPVVLYSGPSPFPPVA